jgi:hypothetical protein
LLFERDGGSYERLLPFEYAGRLLLLLGELGRDCG